MIPFTISTFRCLVFLNCKIHNQHILLVCQKQKYAPSVFEKYTTSISVGGKEIKLNLYDTAGKKAYKKKPNLIIVHCLGMITNPCWFERGRG